METKHTSACALLQLTTFICSVQRSPNLAIQVQAWTPVQYMYVYISTQTVTSNLNTTSHLDHMAVDSKHTSHEEMLRELLSDRLVHACPHQHPR